MSDVVTRLYLPSTRPSSPSGRQSVLVRGLFAIQSKSRKDLIISIAIKTKIFQGVCPCLAMTFLKILL